MTNPYKPPQEEPGPGLQELPSPSVRRCLGLALEITSLFSIIGVIVHLFFYVLLHAIIETQVWTILACSICSVLFLLALGKNSLPAHVAQLCCVISGWIAIMCSGMLLLNGWQAGVWDEQLTFYQRAYGLHVWSWFLYIAILGILPTFLGFARIRSSLWLAIPILLLTTPIALIYVLARLFGHLMGA